MQEGLIRAGVTQRVIRQGEIYLVPGDLIVLPKARLPAQQKKKRKWRAALIVQGERDNQELFYPLVLVAPLSSRVDLKGKQDMELTAEETGWDKPCIAMLGLIQPVLKIELGKGPLGCLSDDRLEEALTFIGNNLGIFDIMQR